MLMLQFISKSLAVLFIALVLGGCQSKAQPNDASSGLFEYRGLYTPSNTEEMQKAMHTNHPDYDWGLWGHNLSKVIKDNATDGMFAVVDGKRNRKQLCFSSKELYKCVHEYIIDQFGNGSSEYNERISIMPLDNKVACMCAACRAKGNTEGNATPAVTSFVSRLAKEFPKHKFFTSAYHTTKIAPTSSLPKNVGVFISSIDLPMCVDFSKTAGYKSFVSMVKSWKPRCGKIYIWDYERNYDDYLSPFSCLLAMQARFKLYRQLGVKGIFVNGSGDDYSAFDDMQSYVIASLMDNPDIDVHKAVGKYFSKYYPVTADILLKYYWGLEMRSKTTNHILPLYGTMKEMCDSYLNAKEFVDFRRKLDAKSKFTSGDERKRLNALLTSLSYTQLELYRCGIIPKDAEAAIEMREILKGHKELKGMVNRDESGHHIDDYLKQWK